MGESWTHSQLSTTELTSKRTGSDYNDRWASLVATVPLRTDAYNSFTNLKKGSYLKHSFPTVLLNLLSLTNKHVLLWLFTINHRNSCNQALSKFTQYWQPTKWLLPRGKWHHATEQTPCNQIDQPIQWSSYNKDTDPMHIASGPKCI